MGVEYYIFALFVFGLALIIVFLALKGRRKNRTEDGGALEEKKQEIMLTMFEAEQLLAELKDYVKNSEEKISLQLRRLEMDMQAFELAKEKDSMLDRPPVVEFKTMKPEEKAPPREEARIQDGKELYREAEQMRRNGMNVAQIARTLHISAGETNLILKMAGEAKAVSQHSATR